MPTAKKPQIQGAQIRSAQQMARQAIQGQRGPERQQGVDLRHARLQRELHGEGQQQRGQHSHAAIPQPPPQVVGQQQGAQCRQQGRQQERQARAAG